jgi:hypothetical protein
VSNTTSTLMIVITLVVMMLWQRLVILRILKLPCAWRNLLIALRHEERP